LFQGGAKALLSTAGKAASKTIIPTQPSISNVRNPTSKTRKLSSDIFKEDNIDFAKGTINLGSGAIKASKSLTVSKINLGKSTKSITVLPLGKGTSKFIDRGGSAGLPSSSVKPSSAPPDTPKTKSAQVLELVTKQKAKGEATFIKLGKGEGQLIKSKKPENVFKKETINLGKSTKTKTIQQTSKKQKQIPPLIISSIPQEQTQEQVLRVPQDTPKAVLSPKIGIATTQIITPITKTPSIQIISAIPKQPPIQKTIVTVIPKLGTPQTPDTILITPPRNPPTL